MLHGSQEAQEQQSSADAAQGDSNAHVYEIRRMLCRMGGNQTDQSTGISVRADHKEEFRNVLCVARLSHCAYLHETEASCFPRSLKSTASTSCSPATGR